MAEREQRPSKQRQDEIHDVPAQRARQQNLELQETSAALRDEIIGRQEAEKRLARQATELHNYAHMLEYAHIIVRDLQSRIIVWNRGSEEFYGWASNEALGRVSHELLQTVFSEDLKTIEARLRDTGHWEGKLLQINKDGGKVVVASHWVLHRDEKGEPAAIIEINNDITQLQQREVELQRSQNWLQALIDVTQDAVVSIDRRGRIVRFNPSAERMFGYSREEIIGQKVNVLMGEPYAREHDEYIARYERTGVPNAIGRVRTVIAKRKNGELFSIELSVAEIALDQEVHYGAFIRDISEKVKLQEQARENDRLAAIGATAAKIGHEIGNPLNGMSLTIQLLEHRLNSEPNLVDGQVNATLDRLKREVSRLNALIDDFRSLSRRDKFQFEAVALKDLLKEAIEIDLPRLSNLNIKVITSLALHLPKVTVDIDKMKQVILNLVKNASDAMPGGGRLSIKGSASESAVMLEISDTGTGIPPGVNIFEPFFTTKPHGTGLGLAIVQQIVNAHSGTVTYSSSPGKGTTFLVTLPKS
jgi:PAS domain S-box-containing protein